MLFIALLTCDWYVVIKSNNIFIEMNQRLSFYFPLVIWENRIHTLFPLSTAIPSSEIIYFGDLAVEISLFG